MARLAKLAAGQSIPPPIHFKGNTKMALFLSEAAGLSEQTTYNSLFEALADVMAMNSEIAAFNEAVLIADYALEKRVQNLSEGETMDKITGFFKKVWEGIKQIAKKVWARVKDICRLVARKAGEWFSRATSVFGEEGTVPKEALFIAENAPRLIERSIRLVETGYTSLGDAAGQVTNLVADIAKFAEQAAKAGDEQVKVKKAVWEKLVKNMEGLASKFMTAVDKSLGELDKAAKMFENMHGQSIPEEAKKQSKEAIDAFRAKIKASQSGVGELLKAANITMGAFKSSKKEEKKD